MEVASCGSRHRVLSHVGRSQNALVCGPRAEEGPVWRPALPAGPLLLPITSNHRWVEKPDSYFAAILQNRKLRPRKGKWLTYVTTTQLSQRVHFPLKSESGLGWEVCMGGKRLIYNIWKPDELFGRYPSHWFPPFTRTIFWQSTNRGSGRGRGRSRLLVEQGAQCGARSQDPGIMTWDEGRHLTNWAT